MSRAGEREPPALVEAALAGDRRALARLLSIVEAGGPPARQVSSIAFPLGRGAYTVGITGAPGAGKSTLTSGLIGELRRPSVDGAAGVPVAVVAVDPSSPFSGGAILGDRVRMQEHVLDGGVFIRSMASRGHLGGLSLAVPEAIRVLDASGWPIVLVETVGVGQVEVEVAGTCDTTVVVLNPGWGDSVQANKAGLLEIADVFVINKADRPGLREARRDLKQMLQLSHMYDDPDEARWVPPVVTSVATSQEGITGLWEAIASHRTHLEERGLLERRRLERLDGELRRIVGARIEIALSTVSGGDAYQLARKRLLDRSADPYEAADELLDDVVDSLARPASDPGL